MSLLPFFNKDSQPPPPPMKSAPKELGPRALCSVECLSWEPGSALGHTMHVYTALRSYLHSWAGSLGSWRGHAPCISCPWTRWQQGPRLARTGPSGKGLEATSSVLGRGATLFFSRVSFVTESSRLVGDLLTLERVMYFSSPKARMTSNKGQSWLCSVVPEGLSTWFWKEYVLFQSTSSSPHVLARFEAVSWRPITAV